MKPLICAATIALLAVPLAWAQAKLDAQTLKDFGGTYMVDCANNASPKATVFADALVFLHGERRVAGSQPQSAASFYGPNQPSEFRTVLLSEAPGGQLRLAIFQDKAGYYLLLDPKSKAAYFKALGPLAREPWLARLDGPSPENKRVTVAGASYVQVGVCKNHDCQDNSALFLYSAERNVLYGFVAIRGRAGLIGAPPPAVAAELPKMWKKEWRKQ